MSLENKIVLITGGGSGIGRAAAQAFAAQGCRVAITGRREDVLREAAAAYEGQPAIECRAADVSDLASVQELFRWVAETLGPVDILINSAGANIKNRQMAEMTPQQWDQVMAINASGAYYCMYCALPAMRERGDGLVVNISSIAGKRASALGGVAYSASKFAMTALGTAVGNEDAKNGVRVTNVYPGEVNTPILDNRPKPVSDEHRQSILQPTDVAHMLVALAQLPPRAHVPEMVIKPLRQEYA